MNIHQTSPRSDCTHFAKCGKRSIAYCRRYGAHECLSCQLVKRKPKNREDVKEHMLEILRAWVFTDWETPFVAIINGQIVGMASIMKTDYYPLPEIYPWVSSLFVVEDYRGNRISERLIDFANNRFRLHASSNFWNKRSVFPSSAKSSMAVSGISNCV